MIAPHYPFFLANKPVTSSHTLEVLDKYTGEVATRVSLAQTSDIDHAIAAATRAARPMAEMPGHKRQAILQHCITRIEARAEELAHMLCIEAGKPIKDSRGEVSRLVDTFRIAAEEAVRHHGEIMPLDRTPRTTGYTGFIKRVPIGPCSFISPWNFPLNLTAHKIAPALAVGCPFVLKPASYTPLGAIVLGEILAETDLPEGAFSIVPCKRDSADPLTTDERLKLLSFTGSPEVGWALKAKAGRKRVVLELGGNAGCIIDADTDIADAVKRVVFGAFYQSGQSCISVQRIYAHEAIYEPFRDQLVAAIGALKCGNPHDEDTFIGPMITEADARRAESAVKAAVNAGARLLTGGKRHGSILEPTLLEDAAPEQEVCAREVFAPVAVISRFSDFDAALDAVNNSDFGLQAGIFTRDIHKAMRAWNRLEVGGVIIGDVPSWRADAMPYGGVKHSGFGREGIRWAMEDMTEPRLMVLREHK